MFSVAVINNWVHWGRFSVGVIVPIWDTSSYQRIIEKYEVNNLISSANLYMSDIKDEK